jgi:putative tryptophan/tyrosine transport system substrate-binding protein
MRRREFLGVMGGVATWSLAARAQQAMPVVGLFHVGSSDKFGHLVAAFRRGLAEADLVEGRNVAIEYGWAEGQLDRLPALAADLMRRQVSVIAGNYIATAAVKRVAPTLPIVFVTGDDPVKLGFVESLNRPGGNTTGVYIFTAELEAKRLGLLRDLVPQATTFALLVDPNYSTTDAQVRDVQTASARLGVQLIVARANSERDIEAAFATFVQQRAAALLVGASPFFNNRRDQLVALAARHKLPATYESREFAAAGGLVSYGNSITDAYRQAGVYAGLIVKGAKPADLPVIQPSKFELVINLKTAKTLGLEFHPQLLATADEVIE